MIYFDHNATTPLLPEARLAWLKACDQFPGNPSSPHRLGARAEQALEQARHQLAQILHCHALDIVWTSGATESNNLILYHLAQTLPPDAIIWISSIEHPCLLQAARHYFPNRHRLIPVRNHGAIDLDWLNREFKKHPPSLIATMAANNETGAIQPWQEVRKLCLQSGVPFLCDAAQWLGKLPAHGLGQCEFVTGCAHKFGGPKGVGFAKAHTLLQPLLKGGTQEDGRRAGTENVPGVLAMLAALEKREEQIARKTHLHLENWKNRFTQDLLQNLPGTRLTAGSHAACLWNTASVVMPDTNCQIRWVVKMDKTGYAVSTGSACSSGKEESSHVLAAMGLTPAEAGRVLRISGGWENTETEWKQLLQGFTKVHEEVQARANR